ncbi:hypothetical protein IWW35_005114 [Coemansia sp. RSA 1878]|nr:hypothetical protein IWW35_005114 [Coemansia sp. RSA 1878]
MYVADDQLNWLDLLLQVQFAYNNLVHHLTGFTPYVVVHSHHLPHPMLPSDPVVLLLTADDITEAEPELYTQVHTVLTTANIQYAHAHDAKHLDIPELGPGDFVWLSNKNLPL